MKIHPALAELAFPVAELSPLEGNPRSGDVAAVVRSYSRFGQRKPIVARRTSDGRCEVVAGNHQLAAAQQLGWQTIAVVFTDDDDLTAHAFALADNRTSELGGYDDELLADMIGEIALAPDLLEATSFSLADLERLQGVEREGRSTEPQLTGMAYSIIVQCDNERHQTELLDRFQAERIDCRAVIA